MDTIDNEKLTDTEKALCEYFNLHWLSDSTSVYTTKTIKEFAEYLDARAHQEQNEARIDELKELQIAPNVSDAAKDENYEGYIKDRVAELKHQEGGQQ